VEIASLRRVYRAHGNNTNNGSEKKESPWACWLTLQNQVLRPGYLTLIQIAEKLGVS
jgi:hypothetical protein